MKHEYELKQIAKALNQENICWALGGSLMLQFLNIKVQANDIDVIIKEDDIQPAVRILKTLGDGERGKPRFPFCTKHFYQFRIGQTTVDVMAGLAIQHEKGMYHYPFDEASVSKTVKLDSEKIPLSRPEDWYIIYQLIPGREKKVECLRNHLDL